MAKQVVTLYIKSLIIISLDKHFILWLENKLNTVFIKYLLC